MKPALLISGLNRVLLAALAGSFLMIACSEGSSAQGESPTEEAPRSKAAPETEPGQKKADLSKSVGASEKLRVQVVAEYPHDRRAYTQGLLWHEGFLFESTGQWGQSDVRRTDLATGSVLGSRRLDQQLFGEGLARVGDVFYQLTWQAQIGLMYEVDTLEPAGQFYYEGEGWGLCFDGEHLVMSNGGPALSFRDPATFKEVRKVRVKNEGRPVFRLNELECVGADIYANVYGTDSLVRIRRETGEVTAWIDASGLLTPSERRRAEVLNGIAYVPERETFLLTGKYWPKIFEVTLSRD